MSIALLINDEFPSDYAEENSNLLRRTDQNEITPSKRGRYVFIKYVSAKVMPKKYTHWRTPKIVTGKRWYVEFYYKNLSDKWQRFRVFEDININKTLQYAHMLRDAVELALQQGYNPFEDEERKAKEEKAGITPKKIWTISQALIFFKQKWSERGIAPESLQKYDYAINRFIHWLNMVALAHTPAEEVSKKHIEAELNYYSKENNWSNRSYNNELTLLATAFNFLHKEQIIPVTLTTSIDRKKTKSKKHRYYDEKLLPLVKKAMSEYDPYLNFAAECVYGLCLRSEKELMGLKVGNIYPDRKQAYITPEGSKTDGRYIPMTEGTVEKFKERGILDLPGDWFVFGKMGKPGPVRCGKRWFATQFSEVRKRMKMEGVYTLYGFKHTRIVHMKKDGAKDDEIMAVTGHTDFVSYSKYLRDLGVDVDVEAIEQKSRKW